MVDNVDIILPVYNSEHTIKETIRSVLNQTHIDFRLIVCDDGSTDKSLLIVNEFAASDSRVFLTHNKYEKGASGARLTALEFVEAKWIAYIDADDTWMEYKLESQLNICKRHAVDFTYSDYLNINIDTFATFLVTAPAAVSSRYFHLANFFGCSTVLHSASLIVKFSPYLKKRNDYLMWLMMAKEKEFLAIKTPGVMALYKNRSDSLSKGRISNVRMHFVLMQLVFGFGFLKTLPLLVFHVIYMYLKKSCIFSGLINKMEIK